MKKAFTLVELLIVMVIMAIIISMSIPAFIGIGRGADMRGTTRAISSTLSLCRQWAITHREKIIFHLNANETSSFYFVISEAGILIDKTNDVMGDVKFVIANGESDSICFKSSGGLKIEPGDLNVNSDGDKYLKIVDRKNAALFTTIIVNQLTGALTIIPPEKNN
jgi:prepilin-type N-terminal cleavage/methylation domain-containing protein